MRNLITLLLALSLAGCVSMEAIQSKMNLLDSTWRAENEKLIQLLGTRYYKLDHDQAHSAMLIALTNLEMSIENQDLSGGYVNAVGRMPRPLSITEFDEVWKVEKIRAQEITGLNISLSGKSDVIITALLIKRKDDVQINIRFRTKYTGETSGIVISDQAPPGSVKIGYPKIWNEFEKVAFVQGKVIYGTK
jgi:hypothetical protein